MEVRSQVIPLRIVRIEVVGWLALTSLSLGILALIVAAPIAASQGHDASAAAIYRTFSYLCHQIPERSFHLAGRQFAVCSRCSGLYAGFAFATLAYPLFKSLKRTDTPPVIWLLLAAAPLGIDFALGYFSIWQNNHASRFMTGALLGGVAAVFIIPGVIDLSQKFSRKLAT
ncbi:MAG TPA: DUF2085 domain-containing protein [Pyrinomonadaceae bacterium]